MAKIRIVGDSSGYVEIAAPNVAGNNTLELPSSGTKLITDANIGITTFNQLNVGTSGTVIFTTESGLVGIGSTSPTSKLTVSGDVTVTGIVTASAFIDDGTNLLTAINTKTSTGKAIAMAMIFG
jgi:hypothetical protein